MGWRTFFFALAAAALCASGAATGIALRAVTVSTVDTALTPPAVASVAPPPSAETPELPPITPRSVAEAEADAPVDATAEPVQGCPATSLVEAEWLVPGPDRPQRARAPEAPKSLERRIAFWARVWGSVGEGVTLLVDDRRPWIVHATVDCRDAPDDGGATCGERMTEARRSAQARWRSSWMKASFVRRFDGNKGLARSAAAHMMAVTGRKDALARATERASADLGHAESVFAAEGVPRIFARAAFVESLWRPEAQSRAGAAGAYQFMPRTGAQWLRVDAAVDERLDPLRSSWAAATYLKNIHRDLKRWPLVLTAYNTGPARMKRVMRARRSWDLGRIVDAGDLGDFGFDGQNYFAQIVAISRLTVNDRFEARPPHGRALRVDEPATLATLAGCVDASVESLADANPALTDAVVEGKLPVPKGYVLFVPAPLLASRTD